MTTVIDNIFTPVIEKELSKFPQEISLKIKEKINNDTNYLYYIWESQIFISVVSQIIL